MPVNVGYLSLVGSNILPSMVVQQQVAILEFSQEKMSTRPSTPPPWDITSESAIRIRVSPQFWISFPFRAPRSIEQTSLCHADSVFALVTCFIYSGVYVSIPVSRFNPPSPTPWCPYVCSLYLCLYFCFANRFICTISLDSTYMH